MILSIATTTAIMMRLLISYFSVRFAIILNCFSFLQSEGVDHHRHHHTHQHHYFGLKLHLHLLASSCHFLHLLLHSCPAASSVVVVVAKTVYCYCCFYEIVSVTTYCRSGLYECSYSNP